MAKKFEKLMGKFIWNFSGKILRVSLEDIKNPKLSGGLQLPCILNMANALLVSQCIRALKSGDKKTVMHVQFWLGDLIGSLSPNFSEGSTVSEVPDYFERIGLLLADLMVSEHLDSTTLRTINNKSIYKQFMSDIEAPKVVREGNRDFSLVWRRLYCTFIVSKAREIIFLLIHNKLPVPERLFRIKLLNDPYCRICIGAEISDIEHYFCLCSRVVDVWTWIRSQINCFDQQLSGEVNLNLVNLCFSKTVYEKEILWLLSNYIQYIWERAFVNEEAVCLNTFFGYLTWNMDLNCENWINSDRQ